MPCPADRAGINKAGESGVQRTQVQGSGRRGREAATIQPSGGPRPGGNDRLQAISRSGSASADLLFPQLVESLAVYALGCRRAGFKPP
jgi:hypothetical protein